MKLVSGLEVLLVRRGECWRAMVGLSLVMAGCPDRAEVTAEARANVMPVPVNANPGAVREDAMAQWGAWRGPLGTGVAPRANPPIRWSETENVDWKLAIEGLGHSSPVVWGDRIFLTTAVSHGGALSRRVPERIGAHNNLEPDRRMRFEVWAISLEDGDLLWKRTLRDEQPHEGIHDTGSWASASCATDGSVLVVPFGSRGLFVLDLDGRTLWERDLGDMWTKHGHGEGSSPLLVGDLIITQWDHEEASFLVALDKRTGKERWRASRAEVTSWSSPIAVDVEGRTQVISSATGRIRGQDLQTGAEIWSVGGLSNNVVASPVSLDGRLIAGSSYEIRAMVAVDLRGAKGNLDGTTKVLWRRTRDTPYVASPVLERERLCFVRHLSGVMTCLAPSTGATLWGPEKIPGLRRVFSSPVSAAGRLYVSGKGGKTVVLGPGSGPIVLATNTLSEGATASAAVVGNRLILRTHGHLYSLSEGEPP
jgi:outer membrane protein assembly factor BamB